jgi:hypothetical protein
LGAFSGHLFPALLAETFGSRLSAHLPIWDVIQNDKVQRQLALTALDQSANRAADKAHAKKPA